MIPTDGDYGQVYVDVFQSEVYTDSNMANTWDNGNWWTDNQAGYQGRPLINVGGQTDFATIRAKTIDVCQNIGSGKRMGIYSETDLTFDGYNRLGAVTAGLNYCTTH